MKVKYKKTPTGYRVSSEKGSYLTAISDLAIVKRLSESFIAYRQPLLSGDTYLYQQARNLMEQHHCEGTGTYSLAVNRLLGYYIKVSDSALSWEYLPERVALEFSLEKKVESEFYQLLLSDRSLDRATVALSNFQREVIVAGLSALLNQSEFKLLQEGGTQARTVVSTIIKTLRDL